MKNCYVHIPFCSRICSYCAFPKMYMYEKYVDIYLDALEKEINSLKEELTSEEVMNNYKKYNEITDSIDEKEMELMEIMEKWEQLQS